MKDFKLLVESWSQYIDEADALPFGAAQLFANSGIMIHQDGRFRVEVLIGPAMDRNYFNLEGVIDKEVLADLVEAGVIRPINEEEMSDGEKEKKEKIVKGMKSSKKDFKKRYGKDAEAVMYATATKLAKK